MVLSGHLNFKIAVLSITFPTISPKLFLLGAIPEPVVCNEARGQCSKAKHTICHSGWVFRAMLFSSNPTTDEGDGDGDDDDINADAGDHDEVQPSWWLVYLSNFVLSRCMFEWRSTNTSAVYVIRTHGCTYAPDRPRRIEREMDFMTVCGILYTITYWKAICTAVHGTKNRVISHHFCCTLVA